MKIALGAKKERKKDMLRIKKKYPLKIRQGAENKTILK